MSLDNLKINQNIEIEVINGYYQGKYLSKVSEINEKEIKIMAIYDEEDIPLIKDKPVKIFYEGAHAFYSFESRIKKIIEEPVTLLVLEIPDKVKRIQRRKFFRLKILEDVYYRLYKKCGYGHEFIKSKMLDISGGGIKILVNKDFMKGDKLEIMLTIEPLKGKTINAEIVRIDNIEKNTEKIAGLKFLDIDQEIQDEIISWMFNYQRKLGKKGML